MPLTPNLIQTAATRSALTPTHLLHTPESFVRTPLPGITAGQAIVHACPALGAHFLWYTLELEPNGTLAPNPNSEPATRFLYLLTGTGTLTGSGMSQSVAPGHFAFAAATLPLTLTATTALTAIILEKRYEPLPHILQSEPAFIRREPDVPPTPLGGDEKLPASKEIQVRALIPPNDPQFDFAVNIMTYAPGAALPQVEIHYMEHGLLMLEGEGLYLLNQTWYPVQAGDFIWMAPFCPQQFIASSAGAKYLIYKNFNRSPTL